MLLAEVIGGTGVSKTIVQVSLPVTTKKSRAFNSESSQFLSRFYRSKFALMRMSRRCTEKLKAVKRESPNMYFVNWRDGKFPSKSVYDVHVTLN